MPMPGRRSSTSTWVVRQKKCATGMPVRRCCATNATWPPSSAPTVAAVDVPVTLKIRTGWAPDQRNAVNIARIAEQAGIQALAVHGRTRACRFNGEAEYATIAAVKQAVGIPVFANGDIDSPAKAIEVLRATGADGIMIGRAAQGRPWIFRRDRRLAAGTDPAASCLPGSA